jgi:integrase
MPVNDYAVPRMEPGRQRPIESMEEARDWERRFIGEIKAGRNPLVAPARTTRAPAPGTAADLLDAYFARYLKPAGIRSLRTAAGRLKALKRHFGDLPIKALEDADVVNRFKTQSEYARKVKISTMHKALALLRAAIRWGQAQRPPLIDKSPFHRFGVRLNTKVETVRDRRLGRDEEKRLLDAALGMNTWQHNYAGAMMHDRIIGALELCCRLGEMLLVQNKRVDWDTHTIGIPGHTTKDKENRRIPFDPTGRLSAVLRRRGTLGPDAFVFGTDAGERIESFKTAWESLLLLAHGQKCTREKPKGRVDRGQLRRIDLHWHDLRHHAESRIMPIAGEARRGILGDLGISSGHRAA